MVEFGHQNALTILSPLALGDVDVDADHSLRIAVSIVQDEAVRLDPTQRTVRTHDTILDVVFTNSFAEGLASPLGDAIAVFSMGSGTPLAARSLHRSFRQTVQRSVALGDVHCVGIEAIGITTDEGRSCRQGKLQVTLREGIFCSFSVGDISCQALDAQ